MIRVKRGETQGPDPSDIRKEGQSSGRARSSRRTRSNGLTCPQRMLRGKMPGACPRERGGGGCQGQELVAGVCPARGAAQAQGLDHQLRQAEMPRRSGGKQQSGTGHRAVMVEGDWDAIGVLKR